MSDQIFVTGKQAAESLARIRKEFPGMVSLDEARLFAVVEWYTRNADHIKELEAQIVSINGHLNDVENGWSPSAKEFANHIRAALELSNEN